MAGKDDITVDVAKIDDLRKALLGTRAIVDGLLAPRGTVGRLAGQSVDFGRMDEAIGFTNAYHTAVADVRWNHSVLAKMLGDLAMAAQRIHDHYQHAAKNDTISAKSVEAALSGVETDFHPMG
jgi:hypothetical protein